MTYFTHGGQFSGWPEHLKALKNIDYPDHSGFGSLSPIIDKIASHLEEDLKTLCSNGDFIFSSKGDPDDLTEQSIALLRHWHTKGHAPSLTALCIYAIEMLYLDCRPDIIQGLLMASVLGEIESNLSYHNNMHFRKVVFHLMRLIAAHNDIYKKTSRAFDNRQMALLLIAACIHDLGHDGLGNTVKGVFEQGRLEKRSFDLALPYFSAVGFTQEADLETLRVMILCTDVTPLGDVISPVNQMKSAYIYHFLNQKSSMKALNLDPDLKALEKDSPLVMMCLVLHEADVASSAGLSYEVTQFETSLYRREILSDEANAAHVVDFLNQICHRRMLSDAGQDLYGSNMARIYALAEEDIKNGNESFSPPEHSAFILGHDGDDPRPRTIN